MINVEIKEIKNSIKEEDQLEDKLKKLNCSNCKKVVIYRHKSRPKVCPFCSDPFYNKPEDEFTLFHLQEKYLKTRDKEILGKMYLILKEYAKKLIVTMVRNKFFFQKEELEIKAHDSVNTIMCYYLTKPEFLIESSFGGYLNWPIKDVLYGDKLEDRNDSLNSMVSQEDELEEYLPQISSDAKEKMIVHFEEDTIDKNSNIVKEILKLVEKIRKTIDKNFSKSFSILFLIGIKNKIKRQSNNFMDSYFLYCGLETQNQINTALYLIYKYLRQNFV